MQLITILSRIGVVYVCDQDADVAIKTMMAAVVGTAVVPAHVNWALTASAMGAGAVAIGK